MNLASACRAHERRFGYVGRRAVEWRALRAAFVWLGEFFADDRT